MGKRDKQKIQKKIYGCIKIHTMYSNVQIQMSNLTYDREMQIKLHRGVISPETDRQNVKNLITSSWWSFEEMDSIYHEGNF